MTSRSLTAVRRRLLSWYRGAQRPLPWRTTRDPYRIWVSEVMLQQTRAVAVIPYYERFLERFPDVRALADSAETDLLALWSGLGYYARARNLRQAAREIVAAGAFPREYESIRKLPGVGDYTAAAVASIAFDLPHAVADGNVLRVLSRLTNDAGDIQSAVTRNRLRAAATRLLDRRRPGEWNQALMELGATVCVPRQPLCPACPIRDFCQARHAGVERELPIKLRRIAPVRVSTALLLIERRGSVLLWQRPAVSSLMAGFWELPEQGQISVTKLGAQIASFRHSITNNRYNFALIEASLDRAPRGFRWIARSSLAGIPLSTIARKAIRSCTG